MSSRKTLENISPSEVGCQINLITGEHYGPCSGSCREGEVPTKTPEEVVDFICSILETDMYDEEFADRIYSYLKKYGYIVIGKGGRLIRIWCP